MRNYPRSAQSWTILQEPGVFDSVCRNEAATIEESRQETTDSAIGADEPAIDRKTLSASTASSKIATLNSNPTPPA
jgi:hypothetical protein